GRVGVGATTAANRGVRATTAGKRRVGIGATAAVKRRVRCTATIAEDRQVTGGTGSRNAGRRALVGLRRNDGDRETGGGAGDVEGEAHREQRGACRRGNGDGRGAVPTDRAAGTTRVD